MNHRETYPEKLTAGQLWIVADGLVDDALMLLVTDPGFGYDTVPWVLAVTRLSDLDDPRLVVVDDTPLGEPVGILTSPPANMGPQAFGDLLGDLLDPKEAYRLSRGHRRDDDEATVADLGLRFADGPEDVEALRRLVKSLMDVMTYDPNPSRVEIPLSFALGKNHGLPLEVTTDCCPGKSCGTTTLRLAAFRETVGGLIGLRYARINNDDYIVGSPEELAAFVAERAH